MPDRTRDKVMSVPWRRVVKWPSSPSSGYDRTTTFTDTLYLSHVLIEDVRGVRTTIKPVLHRKAHWQPYRMPDTRTDLANPWYHETYVSGDTDWKVPDGYLNVPNQVYGPQLPSSGLVAELADKAFDAFFTQVPQEVDIANFLIDFRDIGSLIPKVERTIHQTIAGGFLQYSFGWKPLIGDLQKLSGILESTRARLAWLRRTYGKPIRLGYSQSFDISSNGPAAAGHQRATLVHSEGTFRAGATLLHRLQRLDGLEGELRALIAALGLNSPGKIVWERIPFSFIVDWVSRVGRLADKGTIQPFTGTWDVYNVSHSYKMRAEYVVSYDWSGTSWHQDECGTLVYECYARGRGLPLSSALFYGRELTTQQLALSAALVGAASK